MSTYLKEFANNAEYEAYINGSPLTPCVSLINEDGSVKYTPYVETGFVATFNVTSTDTLLAYRTFNLDEVEIDDGTIITTFSGELHYRFNSMGNHIVKFKFKNDTYIEDNAFYGCTAMVSMIIPESITSIGQFAFQSCSFTEIKIHDGITSIGYGAFANSSYYTSLTIGKGVTSIGDRAFQNGYALTSIICKATTAPIIQSSTFYSVKTGGTLYVPTGSDYSTWMSSSNYYLGKYGWTLQNA